MCKVIATLRVARRWVTFTVLLSIMTCRADDSTPLPLDEMQLFTQVIAHIKTYYVKDASDEQLFHHAIRGMLSGLDPHSAFLDKAAFEDLKVSTSGKFGGLGLEVTMDNGFIKVVSPIEGTPAAQADIHPGDIIIRLDETTVKGLTLRQAVERMRGEKGKPISLTIIRPGAAKPLEKKLTRDTIHVQSTKHLLLDQHYGYLRVTHFQHHTARDITRAIQHMTHEATDELKGLILDLRNNPGGVLEGAVETSDIFLDSADLQHDKLIVYTEGRLEDAQVREQAKTGDSLHGKPMIVLINEGSASASEIVAGALQDHGRAIIMGQKSFGKGSVQTVLPLSKYEGLKLTTALYYTPKGRSIQAHGIVPDVIVGRREFKTSKAHAQLSPTMREANLHGHLEAGHGKHQNKSTQPSLETTDYQLLEALHLLKGLSIYQASKPPA